MDRLFELIGGWGGGNGRQPHEEDEEMEDLYSLDSEEMMEDMHHPFGRGGSVPFFRNETFTRHPGPGYDD